MNDLRRDLPTDIKLFLLRLEVNRKMSTIPGPCFCFDIKKKFKELEFGNNEINTENKI